RAAAPRRARSDVFGRNRSRLGRSVFAQRFRYRRRHRRRFRSLGSLAWPASQLETKIESGCLSLACAQDLKDADCETICAKSAWPKVFARARSRGGDVPLRFIERFLFSLARPPHGLFVRLFLFGQRYSR